MKNLIASLCVLAALVGCSTPGETDAKVLSGAVVVLDRHDAYADRLLVDPALTAAKQESGRLRAVLAHAKSLPEGSTIPVAGLRTTAESVLVRHDAWVTADTALDDFDKQVFLRSSTVFRGLLED